MASMIFTIKSLLVYAWELTAFGGLRHVRPEGDRAPKCDEGWVGESSVSNLKAARDGRRRTCVRSYLASASAIRKVQEIEQ